MLVSFSDMAVEKLTMIMDLFILTRRKFTTDKLFMPLPEQQGQKNKPKNDFFFKLRK